MYWLTTLLSVDKWHLLDINRNFFPQNSDMIPCIYIYSRRQEALLTQIPNISLKERGQDARWLLTYNKVRSAHWIERYDPKSKAAQAPPIIKKHQNRKLLAQVVRHWGPFLTKVWGSIPDLSMESQFKVPLYPKPSGRGLVGCQIRSPRYLLVRQKK